MFRASLLCVVLSLTASCGPKVPQHAGYKTKSPWKKAKAVSFDEKRAAKVKGELDYGEYKRARWYTVQLPEHGTLDLALQFTPTDDAGDATVALEVLDASWKVISEDPDAPVAMPEEKAPDEEEEEDDEEEDEEDDDGGDTSKTRQLAGLAPGTYHVHLFLTGRTDSAEFELNLSYAPVAAQRESSFPAEVAFLPDLPNVPPLDDTPAVAEPDPKKKKRRGGGTTPPPPPPPPPGNEVTGLVINADASGSGTEITFNKGTDAGLAPGRKGTLSGVKQGGFTISSCQARTCKATVKATIDEVNNSNKKVTIR